MTDPGGFAAGLQMLAGFNAFLQVIAAFLMLVGAYIVLLALVLAGIGLIGIFYKAAHWLQSRSHARHPLPKPASSHHHLKSRHA